MNYARLLAVGTIVTLVTCCVASLSSQSVFSAEDTTTLMIACLVIGILFGAEWIA